MPLFPILDFETLVQENDKTRIDASRSFAAGVDPITGIEIKPSKLIDPIDVSDTGILDWQYPFTFEIDDENNMIDFNEGGADLVAVLGQGEYTPAQLAEEIRIQLLAAGDLLYTVDVSATNVFTVSAPSEFALKPASGVNRDVSPMFALGFFSDVSGKAIYSGAPVKRIAKTITLSVTNGDVGQTKQITKYIDVISEVADRLFSTDDKLRKHESDIIKYIPEGRASFRDVHRRAQTLILAWLDTQGFVDDYANRLTVDRIGDIEEVTEWATMIALRLIFESVRNAVDDIFDAKAKKYLELEEFYRDRANLKLDLNQDGVADPITERVDVRSCRVVRR